jgi:Rieske Fe-S protein
VGAGLSLASCTKPGIAVLAAEVPVGGGKILADANYLVTQPVSGQYKAFTKLCPHALCPVSSITDGEILCHCHGSKFSIRDGSVIKGPASKGLGDAKVSLEGTTLTVTA